MNLDRLETIINCYGSDPDRWPSDERQAALDFINSSRTARQALRASTTSAMQLDAWLASDASLTAPQQLQHRIAQRATEQVLGSSMQGGLTITKSTSKDTDNLLERFFTWLLPDPADLINSFWKNSFWKNSFWKSGLVACLPLIVGMVWGNFTTTSMSTAGFFFQEEQQEEPQEEPQEGPQEAPYLEQYQEELYLLALTEQTPQQWSAVWMEE